MPALVSPHSAHSISRGFKFKFWFQVLVLWWLCGLGEASRSCFYLKPGSPPSLGILPSRVPWYVSKTFSSNNAFTVHSTQSVHIRPLSMPTGILGGISLPIWMGLNSAVIKVWLFKISMLISISGWVWHTINVVSTCVTVRLIDSWNLVWLW